jgi:hypothetical protein
MIHTFRRLPRCNWPTKLTVVWFFILLVINGCQHRDELIGGVNVPVPSEMKKILDNNFDPIPRFQAGQATFEGKVEPREIFNFYQEVMEANGWKPEGFFAGEKDQLAYTKGNKALLITYHRNFDDTSTLFLLVGPSSPVEEEGTGSQADSGNDSYSGG